MDIPAPELYAQAEATAAFAGQERSVRRLPVPSLGHIAASHTLRRAVGDQCRRIGIDGSTVEEAQAAEEFRPKLVVGRLQIAQRLRAEAQQEGSQCAAMRKVVQTQQRWDESVVDQALSVLDATQAHHDGKDMDQKQVGGVIAPVSVVGPRNKNLQEAADLQTPAEYLKEAEPSQASKAAFFEGETEFSESFGHTSQTYLKGRFVKSPIYIDKTHYPCASTAAP